MRKVVLTCLIAALAFAARSLATDSSGVAVGAKAPAFTLQDQTGKAVSLSDFSGKTVVLEWTNPACPFVIRHYRVKTMQTLADQYKDKGVIWLAINSTKNTTNESDKQWADEQSISYPILNDVDTAVGKAYHATNTPGMYIVGMDGTLLYKGAIDNDPDGDRTSGKVNYVRKALDEILAGKSVSEPETKPYGCTVHYRD